jgi:hypothetical protein
MPVRSKVLVLAVAACLGSSFAPMAAAEADQPGLSAPAPDAQNQQARPATAPGGESTVIIPQPSVASYSDAELRSVAQALVAVDRIAHAYLPSLEAAATPEDEDRVREAAVGEAAQAINDKGISVDKYNEILLVARNDPQIADRIRTQLQTLPEGSPNAEPGAR